MYKRNNKNIKFQSVMCSVQIKLPKYINICFLEIVFAYQKELLNKFFEGMYLYCEEINYIRTYETIIAYWRVYDICEYQKIIFFHLLIMNL